MKIMSRMLCNKILLASTGTLEMIRSHNGIIFYFVKRCIVNSNVQITHSKMERTHVNLENLAESKNNPLFPVIKNLRHINLKRRNKVLQNHLSFKIYDTELYFINRKASEKFVELIKDDLFENMSHVIEINPGFGLSTESLLKAGVSFLTLYEGNHDFYSDLYNVYKKYPKRFALRKVNLFKISKLLNLNRTVIDSSLAEMLKNVPKKKWEESTCMQIVGILNNNSFLRHLIISALFQTSLMSHGRPSFYFAIPAYMWNRLTKTNGKLNTRYIMFNTLFNYKIFGTLNRNAFIPWQRQILRKDKEQSSDYHILYVVKLEPKPNAHTMFGEKQNLIHFWYFIRHYFYIPSQRIIPSLEKRIPDCGVRLIKKDFNIFTEFGELSLTQIYDLFIELQSWPEYKTSSLAIGLNEVRKRYISHIEDECD